MKFLILLSLIFFVFGALGAPVDGATDAPAAKKKSSMDQLAPPLELDPSCHVISCYRNMLNVSNNCEKGEFLHSFKKCEKKFFREDTCCKKKKDA
uniref:Secreted protein n=1 Tax=Caenorhabditis tropicalis TaxID=1561998 RepID=A0A1I7T4W3_9PELO